MLKIPCLAKISSLNILETARIHRQLITNIRKMQLSFVATFEKRKTGTYNNWKDLWETKSSKTTKRRFFTFFFVMAWKGFTAHIDYTCCWKSQYVEKHDSPCHSAWHLMMMTITVLKTVCNQPPILLILCFHADIFQFLS